MPSFICFNPFTVCTLQHSHLPFVRPSFWEQEEFRAWKAARNELKKKAEEAKQQKVQNGKAEAKASIGCVD